MTDLQTWQQHMIGMGCTIRTTVHTEQTKYSTRIHTSHEAVKCYGDKVRVRGMFDSIEYK